MESKKEATEKAINEYISKYGHKPTIRQLSEVLELSVQATLMRIHYYSLKDKIQRIFKEDNYFTERGYDEFGRKYCINIIKKEQTINTINQLTEEYGQKPTIKEVAEKMGLKPGVVLCRLQRYGMRDCVRNDVRKRRPSLNYKPMKFDTISTVIHEYMEKHNKKPTYFELADILDRPVYYIRQIVCKYELREYITRLKRGTVNEYADVTIYNEERFQRSRKNMIREYMRAKNRQ